MRSCCVRVIKVVLYVYGRCINVEVMLCLFQTVVLCGHCINVMRSCCVYFI